MLRRTFLKSIGTAACVLPFRHVCSAAETTRPPNIIFIFADDWGYGDLGIHDSTFCKTPNLDRLAREGIDFQNFTVNSPVCSPSRAAVMTGHFPARYSVHQHFAGVAGNEKRGMPDWLDPKAVQLPRVLQGAGYTTAHFGKWHLGKGADVPPPAAYGYDEYKVYNAKREEGHEIGIAATETCAAAADFIQRHHGQPFFINLWLHETHLPHLPRAEYLKQFSHLDEREKVYAAVVAEADAGIGRVMQALKETGVDEHTLVIFASDNGPEWPGSEHNKKKGKKGLGNYYSVGETAGLKGQKRSLYAGGVRVPFLVRWPGVVAAGKTNRQTVVTAVDLLPTFATLAGATLPGNYQSDGENMLAALQGKEQQRSKPIHWEWRGGTKDKEELWPHLGVRAGRWKLLINDELGRVELYDIAADWAEEENLAAGNPGVVKDLRKKILDWQKSLPAQPDPACFSAERLGQE